MNILAALPLLFLVHGGGLDQNGGHYDNRSGEYHCHQCGPNSVIKPDRAPRRIYSPKVIIEREGTVSPVFNDSVCCRPWLDGVKCSPC
jgi:hypothetical protein